jgi:hypothetical protein
VNAIVLLIPLFPTPLRPIYTSLHDLAIALICDLSESPSIIEARASLMVSLYLIAKNGEDGLRDAWRLTAEGIAGSMDILIGAVTSDVFAQGSSRPSFLRTVTCVITMLCDIFRSPDKVHALSLQTPTIG